MGLGPACWRPPHARLERVHYTGKFFTACLRRVQDRPPALTSTRCALWLRTTSPSSSSAAPPPTRASWDFGHFARSADGVGAILVADIAHIAGLVQQAVHPTPLGSAMLVTTTTHQDPARPPWRADSVQGRARASHRPRRVPRAASGPHNHTTAAIAWLLTRRRSPEFKTYAAISWPTPRCSARSCSARGFAIINRRTDNHLLLIDMTPKGP